MPAYIDLELDSLDADQLRQDARDYMAAQAPAGWVINPFLDWILSAVARMAVLVLTLAGRVPMGIFVAFGIKVLRIPKLTATAATGTLSVTATGTLGGTLDAGAQFLIDGVSFQTSAPLTLAAGATGTVTLQASIAGAAGSDLVGDQILLVSPSVIWIDTHALTAPTDGGTDGETDDEYVNRLADEIPTLSPKAVLIEDAAAIARADAEVYRALAIDNFVPPSTTGVAGAATVAVMKDDGTDVSTDGKNRVKAALEANRILNLTFHIIDATETDVAVAATVEPYPGVDEDGLAASVRGAIHDFINRLRWGVPPGGAATDWVDETLLRRNDLMGALYNVAGVRHVTTLQLALAGDALGTADVALDGPAGVPALDDADLDVTVATP